MNWRYAFHPGAYELGENEKFYSDMEAKGWRLKKRGGYLSKFQRVEPSRARYRVEVYTPPFLEHSVLPEEKIAVFADCGWEYVADRDNLHIFRSPEGSGAPEFYDDPAQQAETLRKVRRDMLWSLILAPAAFALTWLYGALLSGISDSRAAAQLIKHAVLFPGLSLFYAAWLLWGAWHAVRGAWKISRTYRRLKSGLPLDHNPKRTGAVWAVLHRGLLCLGLLGLLLTGGQYLAKQDRALPAEPDGPYLLLSDLGWEGTRRQIFHQSSAVTRAWSPLADYWETSEFLNTPSGQQIWMYQHVYRLRCPTMAERLAWALMEDSVFARSAALFRELEAPGLDRAWTTGEMEVVAVRGNWVVYAECRADANSAFAPENICAALAERWDAWP